ncbi:hypothetical protein SELMODRAFT_421817 [Selaginella moellendorffii]|uniref:Sfi1 spindle body domain-containing protein n=1 Tax=Selaginella moellendorffii TaxID=88036 RepID=D8SGG3_SELML|nr:hypothetical protein SELMODRAFT_421817 [Selaginella moellendorffii]
MLKPASFQHAEDTNTAVPVSEDLRKRFSNAKHEHVRDSRKRKDTAQTSTANQLQTKGLQSGYGLHFNFRKGRPAYDMELTDKDICALNDAKYFTYKALPRSKRRFALKDFSLIREIFGLADVLARMESSEVRLTDVLRAYDTVLQRHGLDPTEDTFYYRMLLKLSLRPEHDWWNKLNKEILRNDLLLKVNGFHSHKVLLFYWLQWRCHHKQQFHRGYRHLRLCNTLYTLQGEPMQCRDSLNIGVTMPQNASNGRDFKKHMSNLSDNGVPESNLPVLEKKSKQNGFAANQNNSAFERAFSLWQRLVFQLKRSKANYNKNIRLWERAVCFHEKRSLLNSFQHWQRHLSGTLEYATFWHRRHFLVHFMEKWRKNVDWTFELVELSKEFSKRRLIHTYFLNWKSFINMINELGVDAVKHQAFKSWRHKVRKLLEIHGPAVNLNFHRALSLSKRYLSAWRQRLFVNINLGSFTLKLQAMRKRLTLAGWHIYARAKATHNATVVLCWQKWKNRRQHFILHTWKNSIIMNRFHMEKRKDKREKLRAAYDYWQLKVLRDTFTYWIKYCKNIEPPRNDTIVSTRDFFYALVVHSQKRSKYRFLEAGHMQNMVQTFLRKWRKSTCARHSEKLLVARVQEGLQKRPDNWNTGGVLLRCWTCHSTFAIFEIWRHWYKMKAWQRENNLLALNHLSRKLLLKSFLNFRTAAYFARKHNFCKLAKKLRLQVKALHHMTHLCREKKHFEEISVQGMLHFESKLYNLVWIGWQTFVAGVKDLALANEKAHSYYRLLNFQKAFFGWLHVLKDNRVKLQQLTGLKIRIEYSCLQTAIQFWLLFTKERNVQEKNVAFLQQRQNRTQLFKTFHIWVSNTHKKKCLRVASEIRRRSLLKHFHGTWKSFVTRMKRKRLAEEMIKGRAFYKFARNAFLAWQDITRMAKHVRAKQAMATSKLRYEQLLHTFARWRRLVSHSVFLKKVLTYFMQRRKRKQYVKWFDATKCSKKLQLVQLAVASKRKNYAARLTLRHWECVAHKHLLCKRQMEKACDFRRRFILRTVARKLLEWKTGQQQKRNLYANARDKLRKTCKRLVFNAWSMEAYMSSEEKVTMTQLKHLHEQRLLLRTLRSFHQLTEEHWHIKRQVLKAFETHKESKKAATAACWHRQRLSSIILKGWYSHSAIMKKLRERNWAFKRRSSQRTLSTWKLGFRGRKDLRSVESHISYYHRVMVKKSYFPFWQACTKKSRYQSQCLVYRCFKKWIDHSEQGAFWRCKQKQVTFIILQSLEKRIIWAWHGLVRGIAVRREEHYQQRLIQREAMGMASRTERRQKTELLHGILLVWKCKTQLSRTAMALLNKWKVQLKRYIWSHWQALVTQSRTFRHVKWKWMLTVKRNSFVLWRRASWSRIKANQKYEFEAAKVAESRCLKKAWLQWKALLRYNHERVRVLKECLELIQAGQFWETIREIMNAWGDYANQRNKRRERLWSAEAAYKKHKLIDYFSAWRHYTRASIDSAAKLRGSIQVYNNRNINPTDLRKNEHQLHSEMPPSERHYRQSMSAYQRQHAAQQHLIIQELKHSEEDNGGGNVARPQDQQQVVNTATSDNGAESCGSSGKESTVTLNVATTRHMSLERGVYDGVVATEGWPYELPNGGVAWIRCMVEHHNWKET